MDVGHCPSELDAKEGGRSERMIADTTAESQRCWFHLRGRTGSDEAIWFEWTNLVAGLKVNTAMETANGAVWTVPDVPRANFGAKPEQRRVD